MDSHGYCSQFSSRIRPLLDQYDIIRHHLVDDPDLHPTSIVVIGDQSSGKSSVLESLVQIGLPRGENIVTRMPIVLQCRSLKKSNAKDYPHAKVSISSPNDDRSFTLTDFSQIEKTIQTCQETVFQTSLNSSSASGKNAVSDVPIYVQVVKEGIPDVTLVDLPGINYANEVIKNSIKSLYEKYISPDNVIILNVISAVTDIHANESVLFAHKVDPHEKRTISVLTKLDKCSEGDLASKLSDLKSSGARFVLVRNRTTDEILQNMPFEEVRSLEAECLSRWSEVDENCKGIPALSNILVSEGYKMVLHSVSQLSTQVPNLLTDLNRSLAELGQPCETEMEKKSRFDEISRLMGNRLRQLLDGLSRFDDPYEMFLNSNTQELLNNYRNVFFETQKSIFTQEFKTQIKQSLSKTIGINLPNFLSHPVFKLMLDRLLMNSGLYKLTTHNLLLGSFESNKYPLDSKQNSGLMAYIAIVIETLFMESLRERRLAEKFERKLSKDMSAMLQNMGSETSQFLKQLIDAELIAGPYTADSAYISTIQRVEEQIKTMKDKDRSSDSMSSGLQQGASLFGGPPKMSANQQMGKSVAGGKGQKGGSVSLVDDFSVDLSEIDGVLAENPSVESVAVFQMQVSLFAYWSVLQKRLTDHVHLVVRSGICHRLKNWEDLMEQLWRENTSHYLHILQERAEVQEKRSILQQRILNLKRSAEILQNLSADVSE